MEDVIIVKGEEVTDNELIQDVAGTPSNANQDNALNNKIEVERYDTPSEFVSYVKKRVTTIPPYTTESLTSIERAMSYLRNLDKEIAKVVEDDLAGVFKMEQLKELDGVRKTMIKEMDRLRTIADHLKKAASASKTEAAPSSPLTPTIDPFMFVIAREIMNAYAATGKNIEELFMAASMEFNLDKREKLVLKRVMADMGFPINYGDAFLFDTGIGPNAATC